MILCCFFAWATTKVTDATIAEVTERGFVLTVGTEPLAVEDESSTRYWRSKSPAAKTDFKAGDAVRVRLKTDSSPTVLREIADRSTAAWLDKIRKEPMSGTIEKADAKYLTVKFEDGSTFAYRVTEKSDLTLGGTKTTSADLKAGTKVWMKGRTLPSLDTWLVTLSDKAILTVAKAKKPRSSRTKSTKLANDGDLKGTVTAVIPLYHMFDIDSDGRLLHITWGMLTKITINGNAVPSREIDKGYKASIRYTKDPFGRINASKVELTGSATP